MPACRIIVAVGLPGSGKSSYFDRLRVNAISSDEVRRMLLDDAGDQSVNARVFQTVRHLAAQRLRIGRPETYIDATNLARWERQPYVRLARACGARAEVLFFPASVEVCLERNRGRPRQVPEDALRAMAARLEPPTVEEGFASVTVVEA